MNLYFARDNVIFGDPGESDPNIGSGLRYRHASQLIAVVKRLRDYFPESATNEILQALLPLLCPYESIFYRTQILLCLFLPTNYPEHTNK